MGQFDEVQRAFVVQDAVGNQLDVVEFVGLAGNEYFVALAGKENSVELDDGEKYFVEVVGKEYFVPDNVAVNDPAAG